MATLAYYLLTRTLIVHHGPQSRLSLSIGDDRKGKISLVCYLLAIALSFYRPWAACTLYIAVAVMWLQPDRRIEDALRENPFNAA